MGKNKIEWIERTEFVEYRYALYLRNKSYLDSIDPQRKYSHLTDLDKQSDFGISPLKDIVICDRCNENIAEKRFVRVEGHMVYHAACVEEKRLFKIISEVFSVDNVLAFIKR